MFKYIPKYINQESDMGYGDLVTHENYNEKLNLNSTQGDYNTEVLNRLFNNIDDTYHIPYLDLLIEDFKTDVNESLGKLDGRVSANTLSIKDLYAGLSSNAKTIQNIINGVQHVGYAETAKNIEGALEAGADKYYGTNDAGNPGFFDVPEFIYAESTEHTSQAVDGVYFLPQENTVSEPMLTPEVREKLNRSGVIDYNDLTSKPKINGTELKGDLQLDVLGIQEKGNYVTDTELQEVLNNYASGTEITETINTALVPYMKTETYNNSIANYSTTEEVNNKLNSYSLKTNTPTIQVGNSFVGTPKNGDLLITV